MIKFINQEFDKRCLNKNDIFICAFGYESRSMSLYKKIKSVISTSNILAFVFDDYKKYDELQNPVNGFKKSEGDQFLETFFDKSYYYDNLDWYQSEFIKLFMYKYEINYNILRKHINIKHRTFLELIDKNL